MTKKSKKTTKVKKKTEGKKCIGCQEPIHPKRLEILPDTKKCVKCSTTNKKAGITITKGEGDHTYTETIILEYDDFTKYQEIESQNTIQREDAITHPDDEDDDEETDEPQE